MAIKKEMDLFGIFVLALVTAIGGGTIRDILLGNTPVFFLNQPIYIYISVAASFSAFFFYNILFRVSSVILIVDAIGLGTFVCIGVSKALVSNVSLTGAVLLGLITSVMGGIIRDLLSNEIPAVLIRDFYAMTCILGGIAYVLLYRLGFSQNLIVLLTTGLIISLRLLAIKFNWNFIKVPYNTPEKNL
jgi:uncharacterized membrane protein YeiH